MRVLAVIAAFSVLWVGSSAQTQYVEPGSVQCLSTEIDFRLTTDPAKSDLAKETGLQVTLHTDDKIITQFVPGSPAVRVPYSEFQIQATIAYGPSKRPLLYFINQKFWAIPISGKPRNYTFNVTCTIAAAYVDDKVFNTTDDGHGDHGGGTVVPTDHVEVKLSGLRSDGTATLGDKLKYTVNLKDNFYAGLLPVTCKYYNPANQADSINFVSNSCPDQFPKDPDGYFETMTSKTTSTYELNFRAFQFTADLNSIVGIECDFLLCIQQNEAACRKPCWLTMVAPGATTAAATAPPPRNRRFIFRFDTAPIAQSQNSLQDDPKSLTINEKTLFAVNQEPDKEAICPNNELLTALYGIIGGLALLVVVLLLTLIYMLCIGRRRKVEQETYPTIPDGPRQPY